MKKVSLILTTFNSKKNLKTTLNSIEIQDYLNIEVIIKDGGSVDGTIDIIKDYQLNSKYLVRWISNIDDGIYDAMNKGYEISTGEIIVFFNDEFLNETVVSDMINVIEENPECIGAHADLVYLSDDRIVRYWKMGQQRSIYLGWMPGHPTLFLKRDIYERYGLYKTNYQISGDYEFIVRILKNKDNHLAYLPEKIVKMYYGGTSTSSIESYMKSLQEGHRALKENGFRFACVADILRMIRVLLQFILR